MIATRRAKIVATLGPASRDDVTLGGLIDAGVDVVRVNFAHDTLAAHEKAIAAARRVAAERGKVLGVLIDLPGPKMRTGLLAADWVGLEPGQDFVLRKSDTPGDEFGVSTSVGELSSMVDRGDEVFLADGEIVLLVHAIRHGDVHTKVVRGGVLRSRKGMHLPGAERRVQAFTPQDERALAHAVRLKADFVGLSFVRDQDDLARARVAIAARRHRPHLIAKVETASALNCIEDIVAAADGVMVARGDLGIQTPLKQVPLVQKRIIRACNEAGKPVITATQMLESMTHSPLPTRAEVADIANAVLDGTDALMLSEETAVGDYPSGAVATMATTAAAAEAWPRRPTLPLQTAVGEDRISWAVAHAAVLAAEELSVAAILCPTRSGATPHRVAGFRPSMPVIGLSDRQATVGVLALAWGVTPLPRGVRPEARDASEEVRRTVAETLEAGLVTRGDLIAVAAGTPGRRAGHTDFLRIVRA